MGVGVGGGGGLMISGLALLLDATSMAVKGLNLGYYVIIVMQALNIDLKKKKKLHEMKVEALISGIKTAKENGDLLLSLHL